MNFRPRFIFPSMANLTITSCLCGLLLTLFFSGCSSTAERKTSAGVTTSVQQPLNVFDDYLNSPFPPADGFDFAAGNADGNGAYTDKSTGKRYNGWYIATHFAEAYSIRIQTGQDLKGISEENQKFGPGSFEHGK